MEAKIIEAEIKAKFSSKQLHVTDRQNNRLLVLHRNIPLILKKLNRRDPTSWYQLIIISARKLLP